MKNLNTMKFVTNMTEEVSRYKTAIEKAETYEAAKGIAHQMAGYINCGVTFLNTMICMDNNDFTAEFDEVIEGWQVAMYQLLIDKAIETKQSHELVWKLLQKRDEYAA